MKIHLCKFQKFKILSHFLLHLLRSALLNLDCLILMVLVMSIIIIVFIVIALDIILILIMGKLDFFH